MFVIALALTAVLGVACHRDEPVTARPAASTPIVESELPADLSIELERPGCFGSCPSYVVRVDANGLVTWEGRDHVEVGGSRRAQVSPEYVRELAARFERLGFSTLHDHYDAVEASVEAPSAIITLRRGGATKRVSSYGTSKAPAAGVRLHIWDERDRDSRSVSLPLRGISAAEWEQRQTDDRAVHGDTFLALQEIASAIDLAAGTFRWIDHASSERRR